MDANTVIDLLKEINVFQIISIIIIMWFFYSRLDNKINKTSDKLEQKIDKLEQKIDSTNENLSEKINDLDKKVTDIEKRIYGIEMILHMKDCCMLKENHMKKAE